MKFRHKPMEIDAVQVSHVLRAAMYSWNELPFWIREAYDANLICFGLDSVHFKTSTGQVIGKRGDWIVCVHGELYPCKPDIFSKNYEPVEEGVSA